jgi:hypothetical protein
VITSAWWTRLKLSPSDLYDWPAGTAW